MVREPKASGHTASAVQKQKIRKAGTHLAFPFVCSLRECAAHIQGEPSHVSYPSLEIPLKQAQEFVS